MTLKRLFILTLAIIVTIPLTRADEPQTEKTRLLLVGDSTVKNGSGSGSGGLWGWGQVISVYFNHEKIVVDNQARGGRSSRTYFTEGLWDAASKKLNRGDIVLIQFGHNDGGDMFKGSRPRASIKGNSDEVREGVVEETNKMESVHSYGWYIRRYVEDAKAKGAIPIVLSPVPRNIWKEERILRATNDYGKWAKEAAEQSGALFVDLNSIAADRYDRMGKDQVSKLFPETDHTHTNEQGAIVLAECVLDGLKLIKQFSGSELFVVGR